MAINRSTLLASVTAVLVTGAGVLTAGGASAAMVCFGGDLGSPSCTASGEQMVFLEGATGEGASNDPGIGNIGSATGFPVDFTTGTGGHVNLDNGFATIKPTAADSFSILDISTPGRTFTDLEFGMQMFNASGPLNVTITAWDGSTELGSVTYTSASGLRHDADQEYIIEAAPGVVITRVDVSSTSGIKQMKHFEVSDASAIPESSTWAMLALGFAALGFVGYRKSRKSISFAA